MSMVMMPAYGIATDIFRYFANRYASTCRPE